MTGLRYIGAGGWAADLSDPAQGQPAQRYNQPFYGTSPPDQSQPQFNQGTPPGYETSRLVMTHRKTRWLATNCSRTFLERN